MRRLIVYITITLIATFVSATSPVNAQQSSHSVTYDFSFYMKEDSPDVDVVLDITLTNLRSDVYITEYSIKLPKYLTFSNLLITDGVSKVPFVTAERSDYKELIFRFDEPDTGALSKNTLKLQYTLENMHTFSGTINEIILPLLIGDEQSVVNATLYLPRGFDRIVSLSKPVPDINELTRLHWDDVQEKAILALFGTSQMYDVRLSYSLANTGLIPEKRTIALPPETLYQKVYVNTLDPEPAKTFTDGDGNYLAEYSVPARSGIDITFDGYVEVFTRPQSTLRDHIRRQFADNENVYLTEEDLWSLGSHLRSVPLSDMENIRDVYTYVLSKLTYNIAKLRTNPERSGAEEALSNPEKAVCTEFTDTFIAIAREKGIPAREIQGYGFSQNDRIRPQSLAEDVLHAWPEYYSRQHELWVQVDPTWQDTSGIDYFTGLDVNHIALAIHGSDPIEPLPAGFYKTEPRKDVRISLSDDTPEPRIHLDIQHSMRESVQAGQTYESTVSVTNTGNTFIHALHIVPNAQHMTFEPTALQVEYLAPFETRDIAFSYTPTSAHASQETVSFTYDGAVLGTEDIRIESSGSTFIRITGIAVFGTILLLASLGILKKIRS